MSSANLLKSNCLSSERMLRMLTQRQLLILYKIIEHFTEDGQPVSSKTLVDEGFVAASSATIRKDRKSVV